ncbi:hypothetical protein CBS63078_4198 [Aspergillus niger]|nr:hypothetical protein CBS11350_1886 [Aspergillus niger]KAI2910066.1 hypothetical protein CBS63078_4198 [Aspergillus niger]KAI2966195.1 hypothetical protein CBS147323_5416 [Aspergillus niger]KAI3028515.1 hypothetical protein CBS147347_3769 [Aspergillus niger]KAI3076782.1 hypothetical protein CBS147353_4720 [Aspergillus niger]
MNAATKVLLLPELLEAILLYLKDYRFLFLAQRVCSQWQAVIMQSHKILQVLWLVPREHEEPRINPFFVTQFCNWKGPPHPTRVPSAHQISLKEWFIDKRRRTAMFHPRASWRRMLLANIPCVLSVKLTGPAKRASYTWKSKKTSGQETSSSNNKNRMAMGEFVDYSVAFSCRFKIPRWHLENNLPSAYRDRNGEKCSWDLTIYGHADTYGMTPNLWGVKTGRPALEDLIKMEDLKIHIPAQNVEEYL